MQTTWKKLENENGFPFYFNESTKQKQWDHPKFIELKHTIDDWNYVKYSKYRVGLKFRALQKALFMEEVTLSTVMGVFAKHKLGMNESSLCLESYDLEAVLYDIFFAANKRNNKNIDVDFAVELMQNFLYNIYDKERQVKIQVSSTKLALALLSDCELSELYNFIFSLCADHNNCVTRLRLQSLLTKLVEIMVFMHEDVSFGQHLINSTIEHCFSNSPGLVGLSENNFITWLEAPPQLFSWISILLRIKSSEMVVHSVKCSTCKTSPLVGLMYRCMKCSKYTQCQKCFLSGKVNNSHKLSHSMHEYCTAEGIHREFSFRFIKKLCGLMPCSVKLNETDRGIVETKAISSEKDFLLKPSDDFYSNIGTLSSPHTQLQLIIRQLEIQNRELHRILVFGTHNEKEIRKYLEEHKVEVATQIHKLKILKEYLHVAPPQKTVHESTPMVGVVKYPKRDLESALSPIIQSSQTLFVENPTEMTQDSLPYSVNDISTWIKDQPTSSKGEGQVLGSKSPVRELHNDLDDALAKLQQILANNFTLDESLGAIDNNHLKHAVSEVEGMLTSFIDNVESSRASSVQ
ncbi:Dystrophin-1-like Protein [Tribolium castaneum]|uniref:Dystrophin-1-like Protein n=1 Tax=Tribolium castaneum TaxID=7070 RepID=D6WPN9_TRICA|nr:PREDICTED: dystrophin, isoform E [Tribolium castaneum]EFA06845.2 Dystrophin-1-like Protein [Tribolium castaneum]|eukprot:XP_008195584.1 PREDICTED: dystrophin, isoform E [Tribolium castaneum]